MANPSAHQQTTSQEGRFDIKLGLQRRTPPETGFPPELLPHFPVAAPIWGRSQLTFLFVDFGGVAKLGLRGRCDQHQLCLALRLCRGC